jgi:monofunctional biosynthetic peptidoglycan transglycosylase
MKKKIRKWLGLAIFLFFASTIGTTLIYSFLPIPITPFMVVKFYENKSLVFKKDWVPLSKISGELSLAVIAAEDQLFLEHVGFDIQAIQKAVEFNKKKKGKKIKGASTISQQTAKNVFLWPGRSWLRKGLEVYFTFLIETFWSKERILEVYLNVIEMGKGIYGAQAASKHYFKLNANQLNRYHAAMLAAILPNPTKYSVHNPSEYVLNRQYWILEQMQQLRPGGHPKAKTVQPSTHEAVRPEIQDVNEPKTNEIVDPETPEIIESDVADE